MRKSLVIILIVCGITSCKTTEYNNTDILVNDWKISNEEREDNTIVLRPADYNFPPSRFRESYSFSKNNKLTLMTFGPADAPIYKNGIWKWQNDNILMIKLENSDPVYWEIIDFNLDKLVVRKMNNY